MGSRSRRFWDGRYAAAIDAGTSLWGLSPNGWVAEQAAALEPGRALDLGAGEGRNAIWLAERGWSVVAVDFAAPAVDELARTAAARDLRVVAELGDATAWRTTAPVSLAVLCYLQLEPEDLDAAIACAADALAPGGVLLGVWHDREDVARGLGGTMSPAIRTTPEETAGAAAAAGLRIELSARRDRATAAGPACDTLLIARAPD